MDLLNFDPATLGSPGSLVLSLALPPFSILSRRTRGRLESDLGRHCFVRQLGRFGSLADFGPKIGTVATIDETEHGWIDVDRAQRSGQH